MRWWEVLLSIEGLNDEAYMNSDGEAGTEGFTDSEEHSVPPEALGIEIRQIGA